MTTTGQGSSLTGRMAQVLDCLLQGKSEKEIGRELGISIHTVHNNVKEIHKQFNVCSRGELCARFGLTRRKWSLHP